MVSEDNGVLGFRLRMLARQSSVAVASRCRSSIAFGIPAAHAVRDGQCRQPHAGRADALLVLEPRVERAVERDVGDPEQRGLLGARGLAGLDDRAALRSCYTMRTPT
jgi:hypothetical protein